MAQRTDLDDVVMLKEDIYPSNSHKTKEEKRIVHKKVISGTAKKKKPTLGSRVKEEIFPEREDSVIEYVLYQVIIPAAKDVLYDLVTGSIEVLLGGKGSSSRGKKSDSNRPYVSYNSYYDRDDRRSRGRDRRSRHDIDDYIFNSKREAELVIDKMLDILDDYEMVTVGDFHELIGERTSPMDYEWGWDNLRSAKVERTRDGYYLRLPKCIKVD